MKNIPKLYWIIGAVVLVLLIGGFMYMRSQNLAKEKAMQTQNNKDKEDEPIPTVDPAKVKVTLEPVSGNKELIIAVAGIPDGTDSIDYELSYNTKKQGLQGIIGTLEVDKSDEVEKQVTLGTCSSGTCVYHEVDGPIKVSLLFSGKYGEQVYENDFNLEK